MSNPRMLLGTTTDVALETNCSLTRLARSAARMVRETSHGSPDGSAQKFQTGVVLEKQPPQKRRTNQRPCCAGVGTFQLQEQKRSSSPQWMVRSLAQRGAGAGGSPSPVANPVRGLSGGRSMDDARNAQRVGRASQGALHVFSSKSQSRHRKKTSTCVMGCFRTSALSRAGGAVRCNRPNCSLQRRGPSAGVHVDACC